MWPSVNADAIRRMKQELSGSESKARQESKTPRSHALGELRLYLVNECRRSLWYMEQVLKDRPTKRR